MLIEPLLSSLDDPIGLSQNQETLLRQQGWVVTRLFGKSDDDPADPQGILDKAMARFGTVLRMPRQTGPLRAKSRADAYARSLSVQHGLGSLPLHTDTAHWLTPARYLGLLRTDSSSACVATYLWDAEGLMCKMSDASSNGHEIFFVRNAAQSFYAAITSPTRGFVRLDAGCMIPRTARGRALLDQFANPAAVSGVESVYLKRGEALIIDNWRVLHGRGSAEGDGASRLLMRGLST